MSKAFFWGTQIDKFLLFIQKCLGFSDHGCHIEKHWNAYTFCALHSDIQHNSFVWGNFRNWYHYNLIEQSNENLM